MIVFPAPILNITSHFTLSHSQIWLSASFHCQHTETENVNECAECVVQRDTSDCVLLAQLVFTSTFWVWIWPAICYISLLKVHVSIVSKSKGGYIYIYIWPSETTPLSFISSSDQYLSLVSLCLSSIYPSCVQDSRKKGKRGDDAGKCTRGKRGLESASLTDTNPENVSQQTSDGQDVEQKVISMCTRLLHKKASIFVIFPYSVFWPSMSNWAD